MKLQFSKPDTKGKKPEARGGHTCIWVQDQLIIFGGHFYSGNGSFTYLNDVHLFDLQTNSWTEVRTNGLPPKPRYGHTAALCGKKMYVFGGRGADGHVFRDIYSLDLASCEWEEITPTTVIPAPRFGHCAVAVDEKIVVFGGWDGQQTLPPDIWLFDTVKHIWENPEVSGSPPSSRHGATMTMINTGDRRQLYVFGGYNVQKGSNPVYTRDIRYLDLADYSWNRPYERGQLPGGRFGHQSLLLEGSGLILTLGGWTGQKDQYICKVEDAVIKAAKLQSYKSDMVKIFALEFAEWKDAECWSKGSVQNRYGHTVVGKDGVYYMFGGWDGNRALNELSEIRCQ